MITDPDARIADEHQVRQRLDHEVMRIEQLKDDASASPQLVQRQPGNEHAGQGLRRQRLQVAMHLIPQLRAERAVREHRGDRFLPGADILKDVLQQLSDVEHLNVAVSQHLSEYVVLLLRTASPRQAVEEQPAFGPRRDPLELRPRPVHQDSPEPADLAVRAHGVAHDSPAIPSPRPRRQPLKAVSPVRGRLRLSGRLVLDAAIELAKVSGAGPALNPAAPVAGPVAATVPRGPDDGPDRQAGAVRPYPPGIAQMRDDAEPAATERRHGGLGRLRPGRTAAVADRDLDRAAVDIPGHPETLARQR